MASASDIITYVGVPLAVLGVLPILYTFSTALYVKLSLLYRLRNDGIEAKVESRLMAGLVEADLPILELKPYARAASTYWEENTRSFAIQGSAWRSYSWIAKQTGQKNCRFQLRDIIALPAASIRFDALVAYLLDLGAVICDAGFRELRDLDLGRNSSTVLMATADGKPILSVANTTVVDSHVLRLTLHHSSAILRQRTRTAEHLPPGWRSISMLESSTDDNSLENAPAQSSTQQSTDTQPPRAPGFIFGVANPLGAPAMAGSANIVIDAANWSWIDYMAIAALRETVKTPTLKSQGIAFRPRIRPEILLICRVFALPAELYLRRGQPLFDLLQYGNQDPWPTSKESDLTYDRLQALCSSKLRDRISNINRSHASFEDYKRLQRPATRGFLATKMKDKFIPAKYFEPRSPENASYKGSLRFPKNPTVAEILYAVLQDENLHRNLEKYLDALIDNFKNHEGSEWVIPHVDSTDRPFVFIGAIVIIQAIGRHAEKFLPWIDIEACLEKNPVVYLC
ncbi:hypothetical protein BJX64DRAFT_288989 [Aspergillus heterothallicus]